MRDILKTKTKLKIMRADIIDNNVIHTTTSTIMNSVQ